MKQLPARKAKRCKWCDDECDTFQGQCFECYTATMTLSMGYTGMTCEYNQMLDDIFDGNSNAYWLYT